MKLKLYLHYLLLSCVVSLIGMNAKAQVTITSSDSLTCTNPCTTLTAHVVGDAPTDAGITEDDVYSTPVPIGFTFNFYGTPYTQLLIGANGNLCFDLSLSTAYDPWPITASLLGNPSVYNCICGPWCDIYVPAGGTITYSTDGVAPNRKFAVTFCHCAMFSCTTEWITTQIIMYETSNKVEVHIAHHTFCTSWNSGAAIIGVQNATGSRATAAPGRDYPSTWTAVDEAWRFTPVDTGTGVYYVDTSIPYAPIPYLASHVYWYDGTGAYIDSGVSVTVCPTVTATYKAGALGCSDTSFGYYTIVPIPVLTVTSSSTNPLLCGACNGTITLGGLTAGLVDTVNYDLGGVPQPTIITTVSPTGNITLSGLCAGVYSNIIVNQRTCTSLAVGPITLSNPPISISSISATNPTFCGVCNGTITLHGLYPATAYTITYNKDGAAQSPVTAVSNLSGDITLTGLCGNAPPYAPNVYDNIVASFGACTTPPVGTASLAAPALPAARIDSVVSPTECGKCDGILVIRGVPPYSLDSVFYSFNGAPQTPLNIIASNDSEIYLTGLCAGFYSNFQVNIGECDYPVTGADSLIAPPMVDSFAQVTHWGCSGDTVLFTNTSHNPGPLHYAWNYGDGSGGDTATNPYHIFAQGIYTVTLTATNGYCIQTFSQQDSLIHPLVAAFTDSPNIVCQDTPVNFTNNTMLASTAPVTYLWMFGDGNLDINTNVAHKYLNSGAYTVRLVATNFIPCHDTASAIVYVDSLSPIHIALTDSVYCRSTFITFTGLFTSIGYEGLIWRFGDGDSIVNTNPVSHAYDGLGTDTVTLTAHFRACRDTSISRIVNIFPAPVVNLGADTTICLGSVPLILGDNTNSSTPGTTWKWSSGQTTATISVTESGTYYVKVGRDGCYTSDTIIVNNDCYLDIPNVFTPNNDGLNDYFFPRSKLTKGLSSFKMDIYNRWGQLIFEATSLEGEGWDGKLNGVSQPEGVYVYNIEATFIDGQKEKRTGNVTLLR